VWRAASRQPAPRGDGRWRRAGSRRRRRRGAVRIGACLHSLAPSLRATGSSVRPRRAKINHL